MRHTCHVTKSNLKTALALPLLCDNCKPSTFRRSLNNTNVPPNSLGQVSLVRVDTFALDPPSLGFQEVIHWRWNTFLGCSGRIASCVLIWRHVTPINNIWLLRRFRLGSCGRLACLAILTVALLTIHSTFTRDIALYRPKGFVLIDSPQKFFDCLGKFIPQRWLGFPSTVQRNIHWWMEWSKLGVLQLQVTRCKLEQGWAASGWHVKFPGMTDQKGQGSRVNSQELRVWSLKSEDEGLSGLSDWSWTNGTSSK